MTSLLHAIAELQAADRGAADVPSAADRGESASPEAVRLALQLRATRPVSGGRSLLFIPTAAGMDASPVVGDAARGLMDLDEGPVHVVDLWGRPDGHGAEPFRARATAVQHAVGGEFAHRLAEARTRYPYVLCAGGPLPDSVETLATAGAFDGVILVVAPGRTTRAGLLTMKAQLTRVRATLSGFVLDARPESRRRVNR